MNRRSLLQWAGALLVLPLGRALRWSAENRAKLAPPVPPEMDRALDAMVRGNGEFRRLAQPYKSGPGIVIYSARALIRSGEEFEAAVTGHWRSWIVRQPEPVLGQKEKPMVGWTSERVRSCVKGTPERAYLEFMAVQPNCRQGACEGSCEHRLLERLESGELADDQVWIGLHSAAEIEAMRASGTIGPGDRSHAYAMNILVEV